MTTATDLQRAVDGAFFEDWSRWGNLGRRPKYTNHPIGRRRTDAPFYGCWLRRWSAFMAGPAFELAVPEDRRIANLLQAIAGTRPYPQRARRAGALDIWFVPAAQWVALRRALPAIKVVVAQVVAR